MTAQTAKTTMETEERVHRLPVAKVLPTKDNPRRRPKKSDADIQELAESIRVHDLVHPVMCRRHPTKAGFFELRAGERRLVAHQVAGKETIRATLCDLDDQAAKEITALENLQREDLEPLEEARAVRMLLDSGKDVKAVAAAIGKDAPWVYRRAKLSELIPEWMQSVEEPSSRHFGATAGHLELIARFPAETQKVLLDKLEYYPLRTYTVNDLDESICRDLRVLKKTPWDLADASLVEGTPACEQCPQRTGVQPELFAGMKDDLCLNGRCYERKRKAYMARRETELRAKHKDLVKIKTDYATGAGKDVLPTWQYDVCKKSAEGAQPALVVSGPGAGRIKWVKLREEKNFAGGDRGLAKPKESAAEKWKKLEAARWGKVLEELGDRVQAAETGDVEGGMVTILALDRLVVPALAWIVLATMFSAAMVQAGGSPRWAVVILGIACSVPYGIFIWVTLTDDRHNDQVDFQKGARSAE